MRKYGVPVAIILLIALDQLVKWWTVENIALDTVREFIPNVMSLSYLRNYGAAWSLLQNQQTFFAIMTVIVMSGAIWYLIKHLQGSWWMVVGLCLVIAGGLGNFIDRVRLGYVVEWKKLVAADYGAPTTRERLFVIARCDGRTGTCNSSFFTAYIA